MDMGKEKEVRDVDIIVSRADKEGNITYGNPIFMKFSGYNKDELLNKPHSILRHPLMPKSIFKVLWDFLQKGKEVKVFVINKSKNGDFYRVYAQIKPVYTSDGSFRSYVSTRRKSNPAAWSIIVPLYKRLKEIEESEGMDAAIGELVKFIKQNGGNSLDDFNSVMEALQTDHISV